jgi:serine acetyltransferase
MMDLDGDNACVIDGLSIGGTKKQTNVRHPVVVVCSAHRNRNTPL